ncbi:MAG: hypothetical protein OXU20_24725 [Myxococcales bacterium]|nr:hypothetical protein [Myxococcales bacterium]
MNSAFKTDGPRRVRRVGLVLALALAAGLLPPGEGEAQVRSQARKAAFLTPLKVPERIIKPLYREPSEACRADGACSVFEFYPPTATTGMMSGPWIAQRPAGAPHVRVQMIVDTISNQAVSGVGAGIGGPVFIEWDTSSSVADEELPQPVGWPVPPPGMTWAVDHDENGLGDTIYDALVMDACAGFSSFPIEHDASIYPFGGAEIGSFHGVDNSTLDATGVYNMHYAVGISDGAGVSLVHVVGKVYVSCTWLETL